MSNINKIFISLATVVAILIAISAFWQNTPQRKNKKRISQINRTLAQAVKAKKAPAPSGTAVTAQIALKSAKTSIEPTLNQEKLEPLRRIYSQTRFTARQDSLPKEKSIVLSCRTISVPDNPIHPAALSKNQSPTQRATIPYIVHFGKPITTAMRNSLEKSGALIKGYLPNYAFLTELTSESLVQLSRNPDINFVTEYTPEDKIHPFLAALNKTEQALETIHLSIQTLDSKDVTPVESYIKQSGGTIENITRLPQWGVVNATVALNNMQALAEMGEVQWIEEYVPAKLLNNLSAEPEHLNAGSMWSNWYLTGKGQIVGHADTGIDTGDESSIHSDFQGQIEAIFDLANGGSDAADYDGHGTHTAGSICGNGASSSGQYKGIAHEARLVSQCIVDKDTGNFTVIGDLYGMYMQSYHAGATIHSDSWGSAVYGEYDTMARITDLFSWTYSDFLPVFAAGNSGTDDNDNGVVDPDSISSPGTSKNALTVGATESDRPFAMEGFLPYKYYNKWPYYYKTNPIKDDYISWSATTSPYMQGMAAFSSRGPTDDNRIKPELSSPGTDIISTRSSISGASALWGVLLANNAYCYSGGTSMSTPLTAGSAALIRQYMTERAGISEPSSSLIKAAMIGGSRSLAPGQYGTGATQEIPFSSPNNVEGWGQPDLEQSVHPAELMIKLIDNISPSTGETNTFQFTVEKDNTPLDIVLCWTDYPGTGGAALTLINDLNLNVITPESTLLYPNNGSSNDDRNTVESISISSSSNGVYTIHVIGENVPVNGGTAALYIRGAINEEPVIVHKNTPYYDANQAPYPIDFKVQSLNILTNNELRLFYNTGTTDSITGEWQNASVNWMSNANYQASIPQMPKNTSLYYYIKLTNDIYTVELPQNAAASNSFFTMHLGTPVSLVVEGSPDRYGTVAPEYGTNIVLTGQIFTANASPETVSPTERWAAFDWNGIGDIPPSGSDNPFSQYIMQESQLTWNWKTQYLLTNKRYFRNLGVTVNDTASWHWKDMIVPDQSTFDLINVTSGTDYEELYAFYGWSLDGARWPDETSPSFNPLSGLIMSNAYTLTSNYMEFDTDEDGDSLFDWWEIRFYGSTSATDSPEDDSDEDLWTNLAESFDNTNPLDPNSYPTPPIITVHPLNPFQSVRPPWSVTAEVSDNFIIMGVILEWKEKDDATWQQTTMTYQNTGLFSAEIDPPSHGAKRVDYRVTAYDLVGYHDRSFAVISPVYSVMGDYDTPWMEVSPHTLGMAELTSYPTNYTISVSNLSGPDLIWTGLVANVSRVFDTLNPAWQHSGTNDVWTVSTYRTWNGDPVWYCGDEQTRVYPDLCHASLDTPPFIVGNHGALIFRQWMDFEEYGPGKPDYYWDGAIVMISTNNGASFTALEPVKGYNGYIEPNPDSPFPDDTPCLGDTGSGWQTAILDLADFSGELAIIRFEFGSDRYTVDEGWYIGGVTLLSSDARMPLWLTTTGTWNGILPDLWSSNFGFSVYPQLMEENSENLLCIRVDSNDPQANPIIDLTLRRGFAVTAESSALGTVSINDSFIFREEPSIVDIKADHGSYITNVTINGVLQAGDYDYNDTYRNYTTQPVTADLHYEAHFDLRTWNLAIDSAYGAPSPVVGSYQLTHGSTVHATVITPESDSNPMVRYSADEYALDGVDPVSESYGAVSFALTNDTALTWLWSTNYQLKALSTGYGVVVPQQSWYVAGSTGCTTGYPASYYHFVSWGGETNGAAINHSIIELPMTSPRSITASFGPNLTSTHGVPEYWLASYGITENFDQAAESDQDNDRMPTWKEWHSDTDPTDINSLLQLSSISIEGTVIDLQWIGGATITQTLQSASTPSGPWTSLYINIPPMAITNAIQLPYNGTNEFFRVVVPNRDLD